MPSTNAREMAAALVAGIDIARRALMDSNKNLQPHLMVLKSGTVSEVGIITDDGAVTCVDGDEATIEIGTLCLLYQTIDEIFKSIESAAGLYARGVHKKDRFARRVRQVLDDDARSSVHAMVTEGLRVSPHNGEAYMNMYKIFVDISKRVDWTAAE